MVRVSCERSLIPHECPNEWMGGWLDDIAFPAPRAIEMFNHPEHFCTGACDGEFELNFVDDDTGRYTEILDQTCNCELTDREFERMVERASNDELNYEPDHVWSDLDAN